jgi:MFS family permease
MAAFGEQVDTEAGAARLPVVVGVSLINMFFAAILEYSLPLYFNALEGFPKSVWADLAAWQVAPWFFAPILAGLLSRRFGERRVWGAAMLGQAIVPAVLAAVPRPWIVAPVAFWNGFVGALMWIGGISLAQVVPPQKKGLANGLVMMSLGVGALVGPLAGRAILWHDQIAAIAGTGNLKQVGLFLIDVIKPDSDPSLLGFEFILWGLAAATALGAIIMWTWGQRPGRWRGEKAQQSWADTADDLKRLLVSARFWALLISLALLGGSVFQASNQFLPYRAKDLQLISGAQDRGWIFLQELKVLMWIPGGLAVGLLAGRRAPGLAGVLMVGGFALAAAGIGWASSATGLFVAVAAFEFVRQFMRWSHAGYLSEHMPHDLRATAIGLTITAAGTSSALFGFLTNAILNPDAESFDSREPFWLAAGLGLTGALGLLVFDRFRPIRERTVEQQDVHENGFRENRP